MTDPRGVSVAFAYDAVHPEDASLIEQKGPAHFRVSLNGPGDRTDLRPDICVTCEAPTDLTLELDWQKGITAIFSDHLFVRDEQSDDWRLESAPRDGFTNVLTCRLATGKSLIAVCPIYSYQNCMDYVQHLASRKAVAVERAGDSEEGREIPVIKIGKGNTEANCLVVSRCHGYETAGNYMVEGMVDFLLSGGPMARFFLERHDFHFIPMMNVDGVANGYTRFTKPSGADLNRDIECNKTLFPGAEKDKALLTHFKVIEALKPALYMNIHNWMFKFEDGLFCWDDEELALIQSFLPSQVDDYKRWRASVKIKPGQRSPGRYCRETFATLGCVMEFPWYGRSLRRMREIGVVALKALVHSDMQREQEKTAAEALG